MFDNWVFDGLPVTIIKHLDDANATNYLFHIVLDPRAPNPAAVWAQECFESNHKRGMFIRPGRFLRYFTDNAGFIREMEMIGHLIEVHAASLLYDRDFSSHLQSEARTLKNNYPEFKGMTLAQIEAGMLSHEATARKWLKANFKRIEAMKRKIEGYRS